MCFYREPEFISQIHVISLKIMDLSLSSIHEKLTVFVVVPENQENFSHFLTVHAFFFE